MVIAFLLILAHLMMRAVYDIENSLGDDETLGGRICSALLRQGVEFANPYMLYAGGSGQNGLRSVENRILKNMPLEMCLLLEAEKDNYVTEYRQPSVIEEMAAIENNLAYQSSLKNEIETESHSENLTDSSGQQEPVQMTGAFVPAQAPVATYSEEQLVDPEFIRKNFYSEDATTQIRSDQLQYNTLMGFDAALKQDNSNVQILVYHTHSQEAYIDSTPGDPADLHRRRRRAFVRYSQNTVRI